MNSLLFQDEIDCLQKEVEELKSKNLSLESQIKTILDPLTLMQGSQNEDKHPAADNQSKTDPETVVEWKKKLRTANEIYEKVKDDVDKLKEVSYSHAKIYSGCFWSSTIFYVLSQV